jgi:hypothetical protein
MLIAYGVSPLLAPALAEGGAWDVGGAPSSDFEWQWAYKRKIDPGEIPLCPLKKIYIYGSKKKKPK